VCLNFISPDHLYNGHNILLSLQMSLTKYNVSSVRGVKLLDSYRNKYKSFSVREVNLFNFDLAIIVLHIPISIAFYNNVLILLINIYFLISNQLINPNLSIFDKSLQSSLIKSIFKLESCPLR